jgi:hypothetical protein
MTVFFWKSPGGGGSPPKYFIIAHLMPAGKYEKSFTSFDDL